MSVYLMGKVCDRTDPNAHEKLVLLALADHASDEGECYPSKGGYWRSVGPIVAETSSTIVEDELTNGIASWAVFAPHPRKPLRLMDTTPLGTRRLSIVARHGA